MSKQQDDHRSIGNKSRLFRIENTERNAKESSGLEISSPFISRWLTGVNSNFQDRDELLDLLQHSDEISERNRERFIRQLNSSSIEADKAQMLVFDLLNSADRSRIIIGEEDDRELATVGFPYSCIAKLEISFGDGSRSVGTGFFISGKCLITAGHCVYDNERWAVEINVIPGLHKGERIYGSQVASNFRSVKGWVNRQDRSFDYGAILLDDYTLFNRIKAFLGYRIAHISDTQIEISGYPESSNRNQYTSTGKIERFGQNKIFHNVDTVKGNSGSPILIKSKNKRQMISIGVHHFGNEEEKINEGLRLTQQSINRWAEWASIK